MWNTHADDEYLSRVQKWPKKYHREYASVHRNPGTFLAALNGGAKLEQIKFGFIHREPQGVLAIDQKGGGQSLKQTRLYVFPHKASEVVHLIALGDKESQKADIQCASEFVSQLN